ncbi:hypothetical protein H8356DRAFT_1357567 [Neocallimastix lanati (nom. inval.)]|nr:hypothetical protein H8356DRAFT_1357567 [Neocallimastix sp. JGI-2020a]
MELQKEESKYYIDYERRTAGTLRNKKQKKLIRTEEIKALVKYYKNMEILLKKKKKSVRNDFIDLWLKCLNDLNGNATLPDIMSKEGTKQIIKLAQGKEDVLLIISFNQLPKRTFFSPISYILWVLWNSFTNVMPIGTSNFHTMNNLYTIRPTVNKSVDTETIKQKKKKI